MISLKSAATRIPLAVGRQMELLMRPSGRAFSHLVSGNVTTTKRATGVPVWRGPSASAPSFQNGTTRYMSSAADIDQFIASTIESNKVAIFSKTFCPYCAATKHLFELLEQEVEVVELDIRDDGSLIQDQLERLTGQRSVPNVFVKGQHIGGNDATQAAAKAGKLQELLK